ncbi:hypothetical protein FJZ26_01000 [Candidatus Parvarchaeota archaeon]|nr:hypothetical protein [Candidatus Parvarchaeota archaeon]
MEIALISAVLVFFAIGLLIGRKLADDDWKQNKVEALRQDAIKKSRAVLGGQFSEQLAPYLPDFPFLPTEVRFLGKPIDFVVFSGMDAKTINEVVFVEVKSGKSSLNPVEKTLKACIEAKQVRWLEYKVPEGITKGA